MKSNLKRAVAVITTVILTILFVFGTAEITELKSSKTKNSSFFDEKRDYDVLFYGSSHMVDAVYPMELWDKQGIVSYNLASNGNRIPTSYWVFLNSLDYASPKLVVLDCTMLSQNLKADINFSFLHTTLDEFPLSVNKIKAVNDILKDEEAERRIAEGSATINGEERTALGLLWPYSVYHSRWGELTEDDFSPSINMEKGAETLINVDIPVYHERIDDSLLLEEDTVACQYVERMIGECRERGIDILLVYLPFTAEEREQMEANTMEMLAAKYGVNCINFLNLDIVNYETDCYDGGHMNPSGARKVSNYLGNYIQENYKIDDRRDDESVSSWKDDYSGYMDSEYYLIYKEKKLTNYLMLLSGVEHRTVIDVRNNKFWKEAQYAELLKNLNVDISQLSDDTDYIVIVNDKAVALNDFERAGQIIDTEVGQIRIDAEAEKEYNDFCLSVNGEEGLKGLYNDTRLHIRTSFGNGDSADVCYEGQLIEGEGEYSYQVSEADWWE